MSKKFFNFQKQAEVHYSHYFNKLLKDIHPEFKYFMKWREDLKSSWNSKIKNNEFIQEFSAIIATKAIAHLSKTELLSIYLQQLIIIAPTWQPQREMSYVNTTRYGREHKHWLTENHTFVEAPIFLIWFLQAFSTPESLEDGNFLNHPIDGELKDIWEDPVKFLTFSQICEKYIWSMTCAKNSVWEYQSPQFKRLMHAALNLPEKGTLVFEEIKFAFPLKPGFYWYSTDPLLHLQEKARPSLEAVRPPYNVKFSDGRVLTKPPKNITLDAQMVYDQIYKASGARINGKYLKPYYLREINSTIEKFKSQLDKDPTLTEKERLYKVHTRRHKLKIHLEKVLYLATMAWLEWKNLASQQSQKFAEASLSILFNDSRRYKIFHIVTDLARIFNPEADALEFITPLKYEDSKGSFPQYKKNFTKLILGKKPKNLYIHHIDLKLEQANFQALIEGKGIAHSAAKFFRYTTEQYLKLVDKIPALGNPLDATLYMVNSFSQVVVCQKFNNWDLTGYTVKVTDAPQNMEDLIGRTRIVFNMDQSPFLQLTPSTSQKLLEYPTSDPSIIQASSRVLRRRKGFQKLFNLPGQNSGEALHTKKPFLLEENHILAAIEITIEEIIEEDRIGPNERRHKEKSNIPLPKKRLKSPILFIFALLMMYAYTMKVKKEALQKEDIDKNSPQSQAVEPETFWTKIRKIKDSVLNQFYDPQNAILSREVNIHDTSKRWNVPSPPCEPTFFNASNSSHISKKNKAIQPKLEKPSENSNNVISPTITTPLTPTESISETDELLCPKPQQNSKLKPFKASSLLPITAPLPSRANRSQRSSSPDLDIIFSSY